MSSTAAGPTRAIVTFPYSPALEKVERLRTRFDPLAQAIAAHITLVFPFEDESPLDELRSHLERVAVATPAFRVEFNRVTGHENEYLFLSVHSGRERVADLHDHLYSGPLARHLARDRDYQPHVTVGRLATREAFMHALTAAQKSPLVFEADVFEIAIVRVDPPGPYPVEVSVSLGSQ